MVITMTEEPKKPIGAYEIGPGSITLFIPKGDLQGALSYFHELRLRTQRVRRTKYRILEEPREDRDLLEELIAQLPPNTSRELKNSYENYVKKNLTAVVVACVKPETLLNENYETVQILAKFK